MKVPPDSPPGNAKGRCSFLLFKALEIHETKQLHLFGKKSYDGPILVRAALG